MQSTKNVIIRNELASNWNNQIYLYPVLLFIYNSWHYVKLIYAYYLCTFTPNNGNDNKAFLTKLYQKNLHHCFWIISLQSWTQSAFNLLTHKHICNVHIKSLIKLDYRVETRVQDMIILLNMAYPSLLNKYNLKEGKLIPRSITDLVLISSTLFP